MLIFNDSILTHAVAVADELMRPYVTSEEGAEELKQEAMVAAFELVERGTVETFDDLEDVLKTHLWAHARQYVYQGSKISIDGICSSSRNGDSGMVSDRVGSFLMTLGEFEREEQDTGLSQIEEVVVLFHIFAQNTLLGHESNPLLGAYHWSVFESWLFNNNLDEISERGRFCHSADEARRMLHECIARLQKQLGKDLGLLKSPNEDTILAMRKQVELSNHRYSEAKRERPLLPDDRKEASRVRDYRKYARTRIKKSRELPPGILPPIFSGCAVSSDLEVFLPTLRRETSNLLIEGRLELPYKINREARLTPRQRVGSEMRQFIMWTTLNHANFLTGKRNWAVFQMHSQNLLGMEIVERFQASRKPRVRSSGRRSIVLGSTAAVSKALSRLRDNVRVSLTDEFCDEMRELVSSDGFSEAAGLLRDLKKLARLEYFRAYPGGEHKQDSETKSHCRWLNRIVSLPKRREQNRNWEGKREYEARRWLDEKAKRERDPDYREEQLAKARAASAKRKTQLAV